MDRFMVAGSPGDPMTGSPGVPPREPLLTDDDYDLAGK